MKNLIGFVLGAAAGSLITWKLIEKKYKQLAEEEIEAVREYYRNKDKDIEEVKMEEHYVEVDKLDDTRTEYKKMINDLGYASEKRTIDYVEPEKESSNEIVAPYVISPDEYGDTQYYDAKCWTYYADFVLADENDDIVDDPESILGDGLAHFGEFADDVVHVRNENLMCDYEILRDPQTFAEINGEDN